jgi:hypothetical protein
MQTTIALSLASELQRQRSNAQRVLELLKAQAGAWVSWQAIAEVCGACAWRTRIADARKLAKREGADVEWNRNCRTSAYRYRPAPLGRDAGWPVTDATRRLF